MIYIICYIILDNIPIDNIILRWKSKAALVGAHLNPRLATAYRLHTIGTTCPRNLWRNHTKQAEHQHGLLVSQIKVRAGSAMAHRHLQ